LRTSDSRNAVHREDGRIPFCETIDDLAILTRPDESDQPSAIADPIGLAVFRGADFHDHIRRSPELVRISDYRRTRFLILGVARIDRISGSGFDGYVKAEFSKLKDRLGCGGDTALAGDGSLSEFRSLS
jgi:hypothetical protein